MAERPNPLYLQPTPHETSSSSLTIDHYGRENNDESSSEITPAPLERARQQVEADEQNIFPD